MTEQIDVYEFQPIPGIDDYECNRIGQVRRISTNRVLKQTVIKNSNYVVVGCNGRSRYVHRLVALTFIPNPDNLPEVDHINNNRVDNNYLNLRWVSRSENNYNRKIGTEVDSIPPEATAIDHIKGCDFEDLFYYNQCFYKQLEYKIRCYQGQVHRKQRRWIIYDVNNDRICFTTRQFLEYWPQFRSDFYPDDE